MGGMTILMLLTMHQDPNSSSIKGAILEHTTYTDPVRTMMFSKMLIAIQKPVLMPLCYFLIGLSPLIWLVRLMSNLNRGSHIMTRLLTLAGTQNPKQLDFATLLSTLAAPAVTTRCVLAMFKYDVSRKLPSIQVPTLIIATNKDRLTKPDASRVYERPDALCGTGNGRSCESPEPY
jgi:pimeloyl-ACP methyl ester carboxylesterase